MLVLHGHPLSNFCQKAIVALYEKAAPFRLQFLDLGDEAARSRHYAMWPLGKMPVLEDEESGDIIPEATIIVEYLEARRPGDAQLIPADPDLAWRVRLADRIFDLHMMANVGRIVGDRLRPEGQHDEIGVADARRQLATALDIVEARMADSPWAIGEAFTLADCGAGPALFYADMIQPFEATHPNAWAYLQRLKARPSYARALKESEPYLHMVPR